MHAHIVFLAILPKATQIGVVEANVEYIGCEAWFQLGFKCLVEVVFFYMRTFVRFTDFPSNSILPAPFFLGYPLVIADLFVVSFRCARQSLLFPYIPYCVCHKVGADTGLTHCITYYTQARWETFF